MNTSPGKITFTPTACLSAEQLRLYSAHQLDKAGLRAVEEHLADCEFCSLALDGVLVVSVTAADFQEINSRVDTMSGAKWFNSLGGKIIIGLSSIAILAGGIWLYENRDREEKTVSVTKQQATAPPPAVINEEMKAPEQSAVVASRSNSPAAKPTPVVTSDNNEKYMEQVGDNNSLSNMNTQGFNFNPDNYANSNTVQNPRNLNSNTAQVQNISNTTIQNNHPLFTPDDIVFTPEYNSPIQFINGLKVTDFDQLYYAQPGALQPHDIPSPVEGYRPSESNDILKEPVHTVTVESLLKSGLLSLKNKKYGEALVKFKQLLEVNAGDINSLFYAGLCWYNLNKPDKCIADLNGVLAMKNNAFWEEALWYKAQALLMKKDLTAAKEVLQQISEEKGFYGKQAREKLKEIK